MTRREAVGGDLPAAGPAAARAGDVESDGA